MSEERSEDELNPEEIIGKEASLPHADPVDVLSAELAVAKAEAQENYDKYLRALAELENFKKRAMKERAELLKYQGERIFIDLLEVVDDFDRALQYASNSEPEQFKQGIEMIHKRLLDVLGRWDVKGESQIGKSFDPNFHHALSKVPSREYNPGIVTGELKKPFFYKDKLIRFGEVVVSDDESSKDSQTIEKTE